MMASKKPDQTTRLRRNLVAAAICLALVALTVAVFGRTSGFDFVDYDDPTYVTQEPNIAGGLTWRGVVWAFTGSHSGNWHPVTTLSHMLDVQLFGMNAGAHHGMSVGLHAAAVVFLFLVLRQMTGATWRSAFVAAVFAIHPLRAESVAWVSERKDVLSGVFFAMTLAAYARYVRKRNVAAYLVLAIVFALGLMSKGTLVAVPFLLLLLDDWPLRRGYGLVRLIPEKIPLLLMSAGACAMTLMVQAQTMSSVEKMPIAWRLSNASVSVLAYIGQMFWPANLAPFYPHPRGDLPLWLVGSAVALIVIITIVAMILPRVPPYVPVGWLWYLGMLVPVLGIVQVGLQARADRYTYLPQIGLVLLLTWGAADLLRSWRLRVPALSLVAACVIAALAWRASVQASHWRNSESLWRHTVALNPTNPVANTNLGNLLPAVDAIPYYETAIAADPTAALPMNNLAWVLATHPEFAVRNGPRALELAFNAAKLTGANDPVILRTLAAAYAETERFGDAIRIAQAAIPLAEAAGNEALASDLRNNIVGYERRRPMRDTTL
jgi:protein O-mannosyl-transferase